MSFESIFKPNNNSSLGISNTLTSVVNSYGMDQKLVEALNKQINMEILASQYYLSMYIYCSQTYIGLTGFAKYYKQESDNARKHAIQMIDYLIERGNLPVISSIVAPKSSYDSITNIVEYTRVMEKDIYDNLISLQKLASNLNDSSLSDFLSPFIQEQIKSLYSIEIKLTHLKKLCSAESSIYLLDQTL